MSDPIWERILKETAEFEEAVKGIGLYHRGYRFMPPFVCGRCGDPVSARQFAFSRSCGGCDVSDSRTARFSIFDHRWFGSAVLENPNDRWLIHPEFIDPSTKEQYPRVYRSRIIQAKPRSHH